MKCPGQDSRYWKPGAIFEAKCPKCGKENEIFSDEFDRERKCSGCKEPIDFSQCTLEAGTS